MTGQPDLPQQISELLTSTLRTQDSEVRVLVKRTSLGWLHLHVIHPLLQGRQRLSVKSK